MERGRGKGQISLELGGWLRAAHGKGIPGMMSRWQNRIEEHRKRVQVDMDERFKLGTKTAVVRTARARLDCDRSLSWDRVNRSAQPITSLIRLLQCTKSSDAENLEALNNPAG